MLVFATGEVIKRPRYEFVNLVLTFVYFDLDLFNHTLFVTMYWRMALKV